MPYSTSEDHIDNIYLNIVMNHSPLKYDTSVPPIITNETPEQASYNVTKTIPILEKCSDYFVSIIRFDVSLDLIPITIMPIIPNQLNPNLTPMIIGINYLGVNYPQSVIYVPPNLEPAPIQNQVTQVITPYYFIYEYQVLINMINQALQLAYVAAGNPGGVGNAPFFIFDPTTQLISLIVSQAFITSGAIIYENAFLNNYLSGFNILFRGGSQPDGRDFDFILANPTTNVLSYNTLNYPTNTFPVAPTYSQFTQQYSTIAYWFSLRKILFVTNTIPIIREYTPAYNPNGSQNGVANSLPILTDFTPNLEFTNQPRSIAYYYPAGQYRLVDMIANTPLQKIDLQIFWEDKFGNIFPLVLSINQQANVKIGFFRKELYRGSYLLKD